MTNYTYVMDFWDSFNWDLYIKFLKAKKKSDEDKFEKMIEMEKKEKSRKNDKKIL